MVRVLIFRLENWQGPGETLIYQVFYHVFDVRNGRDKSNKTVHFQHVDSFALREYYKIIAERMIFENSSGVQVKVA